VLLAALACWGLAACAGPAREQSRATVSDEITRSFPIAETGELVLTNTSGGSVDVQGVRGATVELVAVRTVEAPTDQMARDVLPRVTLKETVGPAKVIVEAQGLQGIVVGVSIEVALRVRAPRTATVRVRTRSGTVRIADFAGNVAVSTTNGPITAAGLSGGLESRNVNGPTRIELLSFGANLVDVRSTNGPVTLTLPPTSNATLLATATNGKIDISGIPFAPLGEQRPRRVRGRINDGGTPIEVVTTNGDIRIHPIGAEVREPVEAPRKPE
jgi:hypothetical protein